MSTGFWMAFSLGGGVGAVAGWGLQKAWFYIRWYRVIKRDKELSKKWPDL